MIKFLKHICIFLHLNIIGVWKSCQEQIWDRHRHLPTDLPKKDGQTLVITGGGRGIGYEAVKKLLSMGFHVILGVRKPQVVLEKMAKEEIQGSYEAFDLDLNSLESVRQFSQQILAKNVPIHVLINNAGIMFGPRKESADGFELQLATNHLGHFLLIHLLMPKLREAGTKELPARVINVSSCAHFAGSWGNWNDFHSTCFYNPHGAYGFSKAAQIMSSIYLNEKCTTMDPECHVMFNSVHPGVVNTDLYEHARYITLLFKLFMKTPKQGGDTLVHAATAPELNGKGGLYLENSKIAKASSFSRNLENQVNLWNKSCEACSINEFF